MTGKWETELLHDAKAYIGGEIREASKGVTVQAYLSPIDGQPVIEIDTSEHTGEVRVFVNDGQIFGRDPEEGDKWAA